LEKDRLKKRREIIGLTQAELAKKLGVSAPTIGMYEQGRRDPDTNTLKEIAIILETSTDYLLGLTNYSKKINNTNDLNDKYKNIINHIDENDFTLEDIVYMKSLKKTFDLLPSLDELKKILDAMDMKIKDFLNLREFQRKISKFDLEGNYEKVMIEAIDSKISPEQLRSFIMYWKDSQKEQNK
jgi:transcriptional regulator with XRE-family HTH domain